MDIFYGFDLGDAESAIAILEKDQASVPAILPVEGAGSFITAFASSANGEILLGEKACYAANVIKRRLRFKSRFLSDPESRKDMRLFAGAVLALIREDRRFKNRDGACFYIGCPAGWDKKARECYREIFESAGYPPARIVSESRAALVSACQSKHLQVGYDILSKAVLVVDIGSSTTDFAYICKGHETQMQTAGEVALGGGIMDEALLLEALKMSDKKEELESVFEKSEPWRSYCEFAARRLKEKYYSDEDYWAAHECQESVMVYYDRPLRLQLKMDARAAKRLEEEGTPILNGKSFRQVFEDSLREVKKSITAAQPELLFLTGGVSRLPAIRDWCQEIFPDAIVITGSEPEFAVARGLSYSGRIDEELREFRREVEELIASTAVEDAVKEHLPSLYRAAVDTLAEPLLTHVAAPVFEKWRRGEIEKLSDTESIFEREIARFLKTSEARELLSGPIASWLKPVADDLEALTMPICVRHQIPYTALSLSSYLKLSDMDIRLDARDIFAVEEATWLIDSIITILVGLLCGGSGIVLIAEGPVGILAGALLSLVVLFLGKSKMESALMNANIPKAVRKLIPKNSFASRLKNTSAAVKEKMYDSLENVKNEEIKKRLVAEISSQIELCLTKMAEVVEIPLG